LVEGLSRAWSRACQGLGRGLVKGLVESLSRTWSRPLPGIPTLLFWRIPANPDSRVSSREPAAHPAAMCLASHCTVVQGQRYWDGQRRTDDQHNTTLPHSTDQRPCLQSLKCALPANANAGSGAGDGQWKHLQPHPQPPAPAPVGGEWAAPPTPGSVAQAISDGEEAGDGVVAVSLTHLQTIRE
jgi:hypothetical protein